MACKRIFLITGTISSPRPSSSLLLPPPPPLPPPLFLLVYPAHLHTLGEKKRRLSNFSHFPQTLSKVISGRAETTGPPGASRLSKDPQNPPSSHGVREPSQPSPATPQEGRCPCKEDKADPVLPSHT